jgi:predicted nucleic-acid-binding protein
MQNFATAMIAIDTNVVIRLLTGDDPAQAARAKALFVGEVIFLPKTVILESEWVLRRLYKIDRVAALNALSGLASLSNVRCEDHQVVTDAFTWAGQGMDFADALHLASAHGTEKFATFDEGMVKAGKGTGTIEVVTV